MIDLTLPGMNGIAATRQIKALSPATVVMMLTVHQEETYRADALASGAAAYVLKQVTTLLIHAKFLWRFPEC